MAVPRTAWVFLWVLRALHSTRGQLTECTAQTLGAQVKLMRDLSAWTRT